MEPVANLMRFSVNKQIPRRDYVHLVVGLCPRNRCGGIIGEHRLYNVVLNSQMSERAATSMKYTWRSIYVPLPSQRWRFEDTDEGSHHPHGTISGESNACACLSGGGTWPFKFLLSGTIKPQIVPERSNVTDKAVLKFPTRYLQQRTSKAFPQSGSVFAHSASLAHREVIQIVEMKAVVVFALFLGFCFVIVANGNPVPELPSKDPCKNQL